MEVKEKKVWVKEVERKGKSRGPRHVWIVSLSAQNDMNPYNNTSTNFRYLFTRTDK